MRKLGYLLPLLLAGCQGQGTSTPQSVLGFAMDYYLRAESEYKAGQYDLAEQDCNEAIKMEAGNYAPYGTLGKIYLAQRQNDKAEKALKKAIELNPKYQVGYVDLALAECNLGRFEDAVQTATKATRLDPVDSAAWNNLGWAFINLNEPKDAIDALQKAVDCNPNDFTARNNLALSLYRSGDKAKATNEWTYVSQHGSAKARRVATKRLANPNPAASTVGQ